MIFNDLNCGGSPPFLWSGGLVVNSECVHTYIHSANRTRWWGRVESRHDESARARIDTDFCLIVVATASQIDLPIVRSISLPLSLFLMILCSFFFSRERRAEWSPLIAFRAVIRNTFPNCICMYEFLNAL